MEIARRPKARRSLARVVAYARRAGPGLVAGASDNDPTTVATMSVAGATTGYALSWLVILVLPMLASIQICAAQVGVVARRGLQAAVRDVYGRGWGLVLLTAVVAVNLITIVADLEAGAAAIGLVVRVDFRWFVIPYGALIASDANSDDYEWTEKLLTVPEVPAAQTAPLRASLVEHYEQRGELDAADIHLELLVNEEP